MEQKILIPFGKKVEQNLLDFVNQKILSAYTDKVNEVIYNYNLEPKGIIEGEYRWVFTQKNKTHTISLGYDNNNFSLVCGIKGDTVCNFYNNPTYMVQGYTDRKVCKHILAWMKIMQENNEELSIAVNELLADHKLLGDVDKKEPKKSQLEKLAFKIPVLLEGDRGSGKTYEVFQYASSLGIEPSFIGGHAGIESIDLLGHLVPAEIEISSSEEISADDIFSGKSVSVNSSKQSLVWKDGALSEAFRKASKGEKAILILDELLRIPQRELNILLTALSPIGGKYHLRTGRILNIQDGIANEETLSCETSNLMVVGTTNVGGQYAVDDIDPALAERFVIIRKDTELKTLLSILKEKATAKGFSDEIANRLSHFYKKMGEAKKKGLITEVPTLRTLSRAIELAEEENEVVEHIELQLLLWVGRDVYGQPEKQETELVKRLIKDCF